MTSMKDKTELILNDKRNSNDILDVLIKLEVTDLLLFTLYRIFKKKTENEMNENEFYN